MPEKAYEKYAWILLFALGTLFLLGAITHIVGQGLGDVDLGTASSDLANRVRLMDREIGIDQAAFSALVMIISGTSYRKGDRWAWYALWIVPVFFIGGAVNNLIGGGRINFSLSTFVALLGLVLPYRKFFPKKQT